MSKALPFTVDCASAGTSVKQNLQIFYTSMSIGLDNFAQGGAGVPKGQSYPKTLAVHEIQFIQSGQLLTRVPVLNKNRSLKTTIEVKIKQ